MDYTYSASHRGIEKVAQYAETYSAGYYANEFAWVEIPLLRRLFAELAQADHRNYCDFACGTGRILRIGASFFSNSTGLDISPEMLIYASEKCPNSTVALVDSSELSSTVFDVVTAFRFFLNAEDDLRSDTLRKLHGLLRDGGVLIVNTHAQTWSPLGIANRLRGCMGGRARHLSARRMKKLLVNASFEVVSSTPYGLMPRFGGFYPAWFERFHHAVEKRGVPRLFGPFAQSALIVARK